MWGGLRCESALFKCELLSTSALAAGVRFLFGLCRRQRIGGVGVFGEVDPLFGGVDGAMPAAGFDAGRDGEAGDGVADHLALAAAETADGIAHEQDLSEVIAAEGGAAKVFSDAELALNLHAVQRV